MATHCPRNQDSLLISPFLLVKPCIDKCESAKAALVVVQGIRETLMKHESCVVFVESDL